MGLFEKQNIKTARILVSKAKKAHKDKALLSEIERKIVDLLKSEDNELKILDVISPLLNLKELQSTGLSILKEISIEGAPKDGIVEFLMDLFLFVSAKRIKLRSDTIFFPRISSKDTRVIIQKRTYPQCLVFL